MQTFLSSEGCETVFPTNESTVQYSTLALVFSTDPGLVFSVINKGEEAKFSHQDTRILSSCLNNTSGYEMELGLPWNQ